MRAIISFSLLAISLTTIAISSCGILETQKYDITIINRSNRAAFVLQDNSLKVVGDSGWLANGESYVFKDIDEGNYSITATIEGYITAASISFKLDGNKTVTLSGGTLSI